MKDDAKLLRDYVNQRLESAFAELVGRHIDLVYSTALRMVREPSLAEDVVQLVFVELMTRASTIRNGNVLPGWLYRVTRCQAINALRAEQIRSRHETEASMQAQTETKVAWEVISPELDAAMATLNADEQNVMIMRFFQERGWRDIGSALAVSEDTAQRRANRALKKLRTFFSGKGIPVTGAALGMAVSANAIQAAPAGIVSAVTCATLAQTGVGNSTGVLAWIKGLLVKKAIALWATAALTVTAAAPVVYIQTRKASMSEMAAGLRQGQVLHFSFNQDEGKRVTDSSGAENHGRTVGAQWTSDEERGGVFRFAPPNQYIRITNSESLNPSQITLSVWIKTKCKSDIWRRLFDKSWAGGYAMSIGGGWTPRDYRGLVVTEIAMRLNKNRGITFSNKAVTDGTWHHLVTTYDGRQQCTYIDGDMQEHIAQWTGEVPKNSFDLTLGINLIDPNPKYGEVSESFGRPIDDKGKVGVSFDGLMDESMIWNRALSEKEVRFLYKSQR